jgi:hypothetical protein
VLVGNAVRIDRLRALENIARHLQLYEAQPKPLPHDTGDSREELRRRFRRLLGGGEEK